MRQETEQDTGQRGERVSGAEIANPGLNGLGRPDLAVLMAEIGGGGMGKTRLHLINELARRGYRIDLILGKDQSSHNIPLHSRIQVHYLGTSHAVFGVPRLAAYLRKRQPRAMLTQRLRVNILARRARKVARVSTRLVASSETHESLASSTLARNKRRQKLRRLRRHLSRNDGLVAVSPGVAEDLANLTGWPMEEIAVVPNPVIPADIDDLAAEPVAHSWFARDGDPVIVSAGRLCRSKNFGLLVQAFAEVAKTFPHAHLVIFGEGPTADELKTLAFNLGVADRLDLPGFVDNPYAYFARSNLFVLPSSLEGLGNVLLEAMAVGTPVVSTDCPSGPTDILQGGRLGSLVPIEDSGKLAQAIEDTLAHPTDPDLLRSSARARYSVEHSASEYARVLELEEATEIAEIPVQVPESLGFRRGY